MVQSNISCLTPPAKQRLSRKNKAGSLDSLMRYAELLGYGDVHVKIDKKTGLQAIVAIHNLNRGPAIGGCRMVPYSSYNQAFEDALRLGYMMSYKAAINQLPHGGAKAVIMQPQVIHDRERFFEKFGEFVNELGGRYITAVDSGTSPAEMDIIAKQTPYVTCTSQTGGLSDPSPITALGVRRGIESAVKFQLNRSSLEGVRINVQGAGHVGFALVKELVHLGAIVTLTDTNPQALARAEHEFGVKTCAPEEIFTLPADVFAPCALGAVLNRDTINKLSVKIVAGAANNQLAHFHYGSLLHDRGILYAPDFLINAGGLIYVAMLYAHHDKNRAINQIEHIYDTVYEIFERSVQEKCATNVVAERIARERLGQ